MAKISARGDRGLDGAKFVDDQDRAWAKALEMAQEIRFRDSGQAHEWAFEHLEEFMEEES